MKKALFSVVLCDPDSSWDSVVPWVIKSKDLTQRDTE